MIKNIIKEHFSNCKRVTNTGVIKFLKNNQRIDKVLTKILEKQPLWESKLNLINAILKNIKLKYCKTCGILMSFNKHNAEFCSKECMYKDYSHYRKNAITKFQKYGNATYNNPNKIRQTCLAKYGVDNPAKVDKIKNKIKETCKRRYGYECAFKNKEVKNKSVKTLIEKYGVEHPMFNEQIKLKVSKSILNVTYSNLCKKLKDYVIPLFTKNEYEGVKGYDKKYKWKCVKCGNVFEDHIYSHIPRCLKCYPFLVGKSNEEQELVDFCKQHFTNIIQHDRTLINPYELDIVIPEIKLALEFNGNYYHSVEIRYAFRLSSNENRNV